MFLVNQTGTHRLISITTLILGFLGFITAASAQQNNQPTWSVTPYLWGSQTKVDLTFRDSNIADGEISFSDLLDVLDLTYLKTSDTNERDIFTIDSKSEQTFLDAAIAYWPAGFGSHLSIFGGVRYTKLDDRFAYTGNIGGLVEGQLKSADDYYDALVGLRYRFDFSNRWQLLTHGDYGFGDSEGVFLLRANFAYTVGKRQQNRVLFGYQYKDAEYKDGDLTTAFINHGPMVGFDFRF
jgi:hypothetical protein